eukprot:SAG31_NODE_1161_length_9593_cov_3.825629_3_plen_361_part_00
MCPPESCCCCKLPAGVKVGAILYIIYGVLALGLLFGFSDENTQAFCDLEHLEFSAECGEDCAVHESGAWFVSDAVFDTFSEAEFPGYAGPVVPIVPLCSSGQGAQKTYTRLADGSGLTGLQAKSACERYDNTSTLASIASADENERARKACGDNCCWLGLESSSSKKWSNPRIWYDGTRFDYTNWWPAGQPAQWDNMQYVFMNVPGGEPGEHCTAMRFHEYFGAFALLVVIGLGVLALLGVNSFDGKQLDIVWQVWLGLVAVTMVQSFVQTSQTVDLSYFIPPAWIWISWFIGEFLIGLPLSIWWMVSVRSLASQCKNGGPAVPSEDPAPLPVAAAVVPVATATAVAVVANPALEDGEAK